MINTKIEKLVERALTSAIFEDNVPEAPEAPCYFSNAEASAWTSGWRSGFEACLNGIQSTGVEGREPDPEEGPSGMFTSP